MLTFLSLHGGAALAAVDAQDAFAAQNVMEQIKFFVPLPIMAGRTALVPAFVEVQLAAAVVVDVAIVRRVVFKIQVLHRLAPMAAARPLKCIYYTPPPM